MLGLDHSFRYTQDEHGLAIEIPEWLRNPARRPCKAAWAFKIESLK